MMLNRDNYEMYFLLYIDNELDADQRREVEDFIAMHPDLAIELADLQNTLLTADDAPVAFPDKELLYRQADKETALLLYIDNELAPSERVALEQECASRPELRQQLQQLQQVVLKPEHIEFENKESLYRHERRRVIPFSIFNRRVLSIAAVLACVAITGWWLLGRDDAPAGQPTIVAGKARPGFNKHSDTAVPFAHQHPSNASSEQPEPTEQSIKTQQMATAQPSLASRQPVTTSQVKEAGTDAAEEQTVGVQHIKEAPVPERGVQIQPEIQREAVVTSERQTPLTQLPEQSPSELLTAMEPAVKKSPASQVKPAVYKELDMTEEGNESLYIGSLELNKNKVAGLFRRAGRLFGSKVANIEKNL